MNFARIPSKQEETPIISHNGYEFKNPAFHARVEDLWSITDAEELQPDWRRAIELYLANFCRPIKDLTNQVKCVACDNRLVPTSKDTDHGLSINQETPTLESRCRSCGYPVRTRHVIREFPELGGRILVRLDLFPMCYHPTALEKANNTANVQ